MTEEVVIDLVYDPYRIYAGDGQRIAIALDFERGDDARAVRCRAVLAQLVLAFEPGDGDVEPDNAVQHAVEIGFG